MKLRGEVAQVTSGGAPQYAWPSIQDESKVGHSVRLVVMAGPLPHAKDHQKSPSQFVILISMVPGRLPCAMTALASARNRKFLRAPTSMDTLYKADIRVDTVHSPFGRTNRAPAAPLPSGRKLSKKGPHPNQQSHVVPAAANHEEVSATHGQPDRTGTRNP